jgi:hypothetical protein
MNVVKQAFQQLAKLQFQVAQETLPFRIAIPQATSRKHRRLCKSSRHLKTLILMKRKDFLSPFDIVRLKNIHSRVSTPDQAVPITAQGVLDHLHSVIIQKTRRRIKKACLRREADFPQRQKRVLDAILERKTSWSGIEYIRSTCNGRPILITDRAEVLTEVKNHFENWFCNPPDVVDPVAAISNKPIWTEIYSSSTLNIDPSIYDNLMSPITESHFTSAKEKSSRS